MQEPVRAKRRIRWTQGAGPNAAFIGVPRSVTEVAPDPDGLARVVVTFDVVEPLKGQMGGTVTLYSSNDTDSSCGGSPYVAVPDTLSEWGPVGLFVHGDYVSGSVCTPSDPEFARIAIVGLPPPEPGATIHSVASIDWAGVAYVLLGSAGEVAGMVDAASGILGDNVVCTDGRTLAGSVLANDEWVVEWRDIVSGALVGTAAPGQMPPLHIESCGQNLTVLLSDLSPRQLVDPSGGTHDLPSSPAVVVNDAGTRYALDSPEGDAVVVELLTGSEVLRVPADQLEPGLITTFSFSNAGSLAVLTHEPAGAHLTAVNVDGAVIARLTLPLALVSSAQWLDEDTLALNDGNLNLFDLDGSRPPEYAVTEVWDAFTLTGTHATSSDGLGHTTVTDLVTGEVFEVPAAPRHGLLPLRNVIPLPEPLTIDADYPVAPAVELPLPGATLPATIEELTGTSTAGEVSAEEDVAVGPVDGPDDRDRNSGWPLALGTAVAAAVMVAAFVASRRHGHRERPPLS